MSVSTGSRTGKEIARKAGKWVVEVVCGNEAGIGASRRRGDNRRGQEDKGGDEAKTKYT